MGDVKTGPISSEKGIMQHIARERLAPNDEEQIKLGNGEIWNLYLYNNVPDLKTYSNAKGFILFVPGVEPGENAAETFKKIKEIAEKSCISLFFDKKTLNEYWQYFVSGEGELLEVNCDLIKPLSECSKEKTVDGRDIGIDQETNTELVSEWAEIYALGLFQNRGWVTELELVEAVKTAHMNLILFDSLDCDIIVPKEGHVECSTIKFGNPKLGGEDEIA